MSPAAMMRYRTIVLDSDANTTATTPAMAIPISAPMIAPRSSLGRSLHFGIRPSLSLDGSLPAGKPNDRSEGGANSR